MAKLSAHGHTINTIDYANKSKRYMSDGAVLVNYGSGWKIHGKIKAELTPQSAYEMTRDNQLADNAKRPCFAAYRKELISLTNMANRAKLHITIQHMPEDFDGIWSDCCDGYQNNVEADLDEIASLCSLYQDAIDETKMIKLLAVNA